MKIIFSNEECLRDFGEQWECHVLLWDGWTVLLRQLRKSLINKGIDIISILVLMCYIFFFFTECVNFFFLTQNGKFYYLLILSSQFFHTCFKIKFIKHVFFSMFWKIVYWSCQMFDTFKVYSRHKFDDG
jgi:hypothetical protein